MAKTLYLCGPINGCTNEECRNWREFVKTLWPGETLDPMRRDYRGREGESVNEIVEFDKIDILNSEALIVNFDRPSVGTAMEILFAFERGKLVVIIAADSTVISPWLRYHSHYIENSFAAGCKRIADFFSPMGTESGGR